MLPTYNIDRPPPPMQKPLYGFFICKGFSGFQGIGGVSIREMRPSAPLRR